MTSLNNHSSVTTNSNGRGSDDVANGAPIDPLSQRLFDEARATLEEEPELATLLHKTVLAPGVTTFEEAVATTVCYRMLHQQACGQPKGAATTEPVFCYNSLKGILSSAFAQAAQEKDDSIFLEGGHTMSHAVRQDALAVVERDPACETVLEVVLFYKGFAALVCHRAARQKWLQSKEKKQNRRSMTALFLQSQASAVFGVDIHPATTLGAGILLDHGTGIVMGETAVVGDGCTLLHGVTLGGTGKDGNTDRHPKIGRDVLIGAGASILGNVRVGHGCKIGAGSIVLRPIPDGATAVGAPAKIIGRALEAKPALHLDDSLQKVALLHKSPSLATVATTGTASVASSLVADDVSSLGGGPIDEEQQEDGTNDKESNHKEQPKKQQQSSEEEDDDGTAVLCPYRDYSKMPAPPGAITLCVLKHWLLSHKVCPPDQVGNLFFALDTRNVGYVHWHELAQRLSVASPSFLEQVVVDNSANTDKAKDQLLECLQQLATVRKKLAESDRHPQRSSTSPLKAQPQATAVAS